MPLPTTLSAAEAAEAARKAADIASGGDIETIIANRKAEAKKDDAHFNEWSAAMADLNDRIKRDGVLPGWTKAKTIEAPVPYDKMDRTPTEPDYGQPAGSAEPGALLVGVPVAAMIREAMGGAPKDDFKSRVEAASDYRPGDLEAGTYMDPTPTQQLNYFPERDAHHSSVAPLKTPAIRITPQEGSVLPRVEFPLTEEMLQQRWTGSNFLDLAATRMDYAQEGRTLKVAGYNPTGSEIVATADKYGLDDHFFDTLAQARSPDDLDAIGLAYGKRMVREKQVAQSATGVSGFLAENAVTMLDPSFMLTLGGVGEIAKVGSSTTRFGNAVRAGVANGLTMAPIEGFKAATDPGYSWKQAGTSVLGAVFLGGALGSLSKGASPKAVNRLDAALAAEVDHINSQAGDGSSVGASRTAQPILREPKEPREADLPEAAPEQAGFGRFGTPTFRLAKSADPTVRVLNEKLGWDPGSNTAQGVTVGEASRRVFEAGTVYAREARQAAQDYFRSRAELGSRLRNPMQQPSSQQIRDFMELVAKVHAGVVESSDPHVLKAVRSFQSGYEDALRYTQNSSYNGPGSEGMAGISNHEFADVEADPRYVMRRFSAPGWRRVVGLLGPDRIVDKLAGVIHRSNLDWITERARKITEDRYNEKGTPIHEEPQAPSAASPPAPPERPTAKVRTPSSETSYTPDEMFGGKAPKTASKEGDAFYGAMLKGDEAVKKHLDLLTSPEDYSKKTRTRIVQDIFEAEGIEDPVPASAANQRKRLEAIFEENKASAEKARAEAPVAEAAGAEPVDRIKLMKEANERIKARKAAETTEPKRTSAAFESDVQARAQMIARQIATKYRDTVAGLLNNAATRDHTFMPMDAEFRKAAMEIVREQLNHGEHFTDNVEEAAEMLMDLVAPIKRTTKESARVKSRLKMDLRQGQDDAILPMFDWNAEALYTTYRRQTAGYAGFLKAGFQSAAEVKSQIEKLRHDAQYKPEQQQNAAKREADLLHHMVDAALGRPPKNIVEGSKEWIYWTTQLRRLNFSRMMGITGFLSLSEVGGSMVQTGAFRLLSSLPSYMKYMHDIRTGNPEAIKSIYYTADALMGHGSSQVRSRMMGFANRMDDELASVDRDAAPLKQNIDTFTRKSANLTARMSGMAPLTEWLRSAVVGRESQDWVLAARKGKVPYEERRMRAMGVDKEMWDRIATQLNKMEDITSPDTRQARPFIDFEKWDDGDAANVFMNALDRNVRRLILEGDHGHTSFNLKRPSMALLFQFLNYPMNAWSKQAMFAMNVRDQRAVAETIAMSLGGGVGYMARVAATAYLVKRAGNERDKYLAANLNSPEVAKAMFYYSAHASLLPNVIDMPLSVAQVAGAKWDDGTPIRPLFSKTRASGLSADPLMGNPTRTGFYSMIRSAGEVSDGKLTRQDMSDLVKAWSPLGNHILTQALLNVATGWLPDDDTDQPN
jgi:hypothetical protein